MPDHRVSSVRPALRDPGAGWGPPLSRGQALGDRGFASGSRPPNALRGFLPRQFFQPPPDRARCHPGRHCHRGDPSITRGECRRRRDQTTTAFVEKRRHRRKPLTNGFDIDHHHNIWYEKAVVNPYITLSKVDSVISGRALSVAEGNMCGTVMRGADALPRSKTPSRTKGSRRNLGDPTLGQWRPAALVRIGKARSQSR